MTANINTTEFYRGRAVLVVGGNGFIGTHCLRILHSEGARITLLSRYAPQSPPPAGIRVIVGDLTNLDLVLRAVVGQHVVFDCAGSSGAVQSNTEVFRNIDLECRPHLNLFDACSRQAAPPVVVFLSSRLVYGKPKSLPVSERHPLSPESIYAVHKITLENYLHVLRLTRGLPHCVLRVANPYGPFKPSAAKTYGIINQFIRSATHGKPIKIYGDGQQRRDYIYIDDLVDVMLATAMTPHCHGETFNIGSGVALSIRAALATLEAALARDIRIDFVPWPQEALLVETGDYVTDVAKLRSAVQLAPFASFATGVAQILAAISSGEFK